MRSISRLVESASVKSTHFAALSHISRYNFSNVWGERTIQWIEHQITTHMDDHVGDFSFDKIPYLENVKTIGYQRKAIVTPCVKEATTAYLIDELLKQNYAIRGIAVPESIEKVKENNI